MRETCVSSGLDQVELKEIENVAIAESSLRPSPGRPRRIAPTQITNGKV